MEIAILVLIILALLSVVGLGVYLDRTFAAAREKQQKLTSEADERLLKLLSDSFKANSARSMRQFEMNLGMITQGVTALATAEAKVAEKLDGVAVVIASLNEELEETLDAASIADKNARLTEENAFLKEKQKEYRQMFGATLEVLQEDTKWIRGTFFQRFGSVPEYQDLNTQIFAFENRLEAIKQTLREYRMIETYDE